MKTKCNPPRSYYSFNCKIAGCKQPIYKCTRIMEDGKICGQMGHPSFYKHDENNMVPVIEHGHFVPDIDVGRNINHRVGVPRYCPDDMRVYGWRLYQKQDRWDKIPLGQKHAMGWDL